MPERWRREGHFGYQDRAPVAELATEGHIIRVRGIRGDLGGDDGRCGYSSTIR